MNIEESTIKKIYRVLSLLAVAGFFVPTFTVSCSGYEYSFCAANVATGYREGHNYGNPTPIVWLLLVIPIAALCVTFLEKYNMKEQTMIFLGCGVAGVLGWLMLKDKLEKEAAKSYLGFETNTYYNVLMFIYLLWLLISGYYLIKHQPESRSTAEKGHWQQQRTTEEAPKEKLFMCLSCKRAWAISNPNVVRCPGCNGMLGPLDVSIREWEKLTDEQRHRVLTEYYFKHG